MSLTTLHLSLLDEDVKYLLEILEPAAAGKDVKVDEKRVAHIHRTLETQYNRGW